MSVTHQTSKLHHTTSDKRQLVSAILSCQGDNRRIRKVCAYWLIRYLFGGLGADSHASEKAKKLVLKASIKDLSKMYIIEKETEIALMNVTVMHPNTNIEDLLLMWVIRFYNEQNQEFKETYNPDEDFAIKN